MGKDNGIDQERAKQLFDEFLKLANEDPNIVGFFVGGSRAKGMITPRSDYDVYIIVKGDVLDEYKKRYPQHLHEEYMDIMVHSRSGFTTYAGWGTPDDYDRYNFAGIKVLVDKTGTIQQLVDEKGRIPPDKLDEVISSGIDAYINFVYRSIKCLRDGNLVGARMEASVANVCLLNLLFAMDGGRICPYYKYLEHEIEHRPLKCFPMAGKDLIAALLHILETADPCTQQDLFSHVERLARAAGFGAVLDDWSKPCLDLIRYHGRD